MSDALVYIILLNWNGCHDTLECVASCQKLSYANFRILVVDNGSTDGSEAVLRERFPELELIQTGANLGFAGGNNVGISHALKEGARFLWLLNNDTVVDPDALTALVQLAQTDAAIGMVGSKIVYYDDPGMLWYAGGGLDPARPHRLKHRGFNERDRGQYQSVSATGFITGCSLLARREMVEAVGLLDESFFLYFEDVEWSVRAAAGGWALFYSPWSLVYHKVSMSVGGATSPLMYYYAARNLPAFVKRHFPTCLWPALAHDLYQNVLVNIKKGRLATARGAFGGIADFFRGRTGKKP